MKQLAILKDKGKGNHGGTNPIVKENILLLTEKRLSKYTNDAGFLTELDVPQTVEQLTVAGADEVSPLVYSAYATNFPVGNKFYPATPKTVELAVGDATFGRVDLILANRPDTVGGMGYITKSEGTPSANYTPNNIDLTTQYIIKWVYVAPNATVGEDVTPPPTIDTTFTQLPDTPTSYVGHGLKYVTVSYDEDRLEFTTPIIHYRKIRSDNTFIDDSDDRYTIMISAPYAITITLNTLSLFNFECDFYNLGDFPVTFVNGTAAVDYPDGTILNKDKVCCFIKFGFFNSYKLKGELV